MSTEIKKLANEKWKVIKFESPFKKYAISDKGRVASFSQSIYKDGVEIKLNYSTKNIVRFLPKQAADKTGKRATKTFKVHRLVAQYFLKKAAPSKNIVLHLNGVGTDNSASNLKWGTRLELASIKRNSNSKKVVVKKVVAKKAVVVKKVAVKKIIKKAIAKKKK
jgi:HNH endonuclease/NUMOD4 motif